MDYFQYIIISAVCLNIFYIAYPLTYRNDKRFKHLRFFLLASLVLSVSLPVSNFRISIENSYINNTSPIKSAMIPDIQTSKMNNLDLSVLIKTPLKQQTTDYSDLFKKIYFIVSILLLTRLVIQLSSLLFKFFRSKKLKQGKYTLIFDSRIRNTSSFFNLIFINSNIKDSDGIDQIILHEKIHATQFHSIDNILFELLAVIMWFNPVVWMMRKSIQQVHEYLADEGVLKTGIDRLNYKALLVNQLTEEKLISISSNFNSLIKKRMIMLTNNSNTQKSKFKILLLMPISLALFIAIAVINGLSPNPIKAESNVLQNFTVNKNYITLEDTTKRIKVNRNKKKTENSISKTKKKASRNNEAVASVPFDSTNIPGKMVYIVDGVYVANIYNIPVETIESVKILEEDNIMVIRTKNFLKKKPSFQVKSEKNDLSNTQIYIDGVEQPFGFNIEDLRNEDIESINVVKDLSLSKSILYITTKHVLNFQH